MNVLVLTLFLFFTLTATAAPTIAPPAEPGEVEAMGALTKEDIRKTIRSKLTELINCYKTEYKKNSKLAGKLTLAILIGDQGEVRSTRVKESTLNNDQVEICVMGIVQNLTFPKPPAGKQAEVLYPFDFSPKK